MVAFRAKLKCDWRSEKIIRASTFRASTLTIGTPSNENTSCRASTSVQSPESNLLSPKHETEEQVTSYEPIIPFEISTIVKDEGNDEREHTDGNVTIKPDLNAIIVVSGKINHFFPFNVFVSSSNQ